MYWRAECVFWRLRSVSMQCDAKLIISRGLPPPRSAPIPPPKKCITELQCFTGNWKCIFDVHESWGGCLYDSFHKKVFTHSKKARPVYIRRGWNGLCGGEWEIGVAVVGALCKWGEGIFFFEFVFSYAFYDWFENGGGKKCCNVWFCENDIFQIHFNGENLRIWRVRRIRRIGWTVNMREFKWGLPNSIYMQIYNKIHKHSIIFQWGFEGVVNIIYQSLEYKLVNHFGVSGQISPADSHFAHCIPFILAQWSGISHLQFLLNIHFRIFCFQFSELFRSFIAYSDCEASTQIKGNLGFYIFLYIVLRLN